MIQTGNFPSRLPCGQPYKFRFEANPIWYSAIKVYEIALGEVLATQMGVTEAQHKVSSFELYNLDPFSPHSGSIPRELVHSYALGCL